MFLFHYHNKVEDIIYSNLTPNHIQTLKFDEEFNERIFCKVDNLVKRHAFQKFENESIYFAVKSDTITNRTFLKYLQIIGVLLPTLRSLAEQNRKSDSLRIRRLKHNLINYNANILQSIYRLVPQDKLVKNGRDQVYLIKEILENKTLDASQTFLRILKSANLMKAEFDVYDMLNSQNPYLDFQTHKIHKVVVLTLNSFWLDLIEKNINIVISKCDSDVIVDYKSLSVAFCHIFDNICKYTLPETDLIIDFQEDENHVFVLFSMISLKIEEDAVDKMLRENYSGKWAKLLGLSGDGIGMNVVKRIVDLNDGLLFIKPSVDVNHSVMQKGIPYEKNVIKIRLNKNVTRF